MMAAQLSGDWEAIEPVRQTQLPLFDCAAELTLRAQIVALRVQGESIGRIASIVGKAPSTVRWHLEADAQSEGEGGEWNLHPEEISKRCREIRRTWTPEERANRAGRLPNQETVEIRILESGERDAPEHALWSEFLARDDYSPSGEWR